MENSGIGWIVLPKFLYQIQNEKPKLNNQKIRDVRFRSRRTK